MPSAVQAAAVEADKKAWLKQQQAEQQRWKQEEKKQREEKKTAILKLKVLRRFACLLAALTTIQACCGDKQQLHVPQAASGWHSICGPAVEHVAWTLGLQDTLGPAKASFGHLLIPMFFSIMHKGAHCHPPWRKLICTCSCC